MAKDPSKTEKATHKRRQKAREEGQVARSQDIPISATLLAVFLLLLFYIPYASDLLIDYNKQLFADPLFFSPGLNKQSILNAVKTFALLILPVFLTLLTVGILSNVSQFGFLFTFKSMAPKLDKINPVSGLQRLLSLKTLFELVRNVLKLAMASTIAFFLLTYLLDDVLRFAYIPVNQEGYYLIRYTLIMILAFALLSIPIAVIDFLYRRYDYEENIKMSKHEVKEEHKMFEGNPAVKSAIRKKQREMSMLRMMAEVAKADVVIVNPEHYAVALAYERGKMQAPRVVAKGIDHVALRIKEVAREHNVPITENPPLARSLYQGCEIGDFVPENLYAAIAKILAKIYKKKRTV